MSVKSVVTLLAALLLFSCGGGESSEAAGEAAAQPQNQGEEGGSGLPPDPAAVDPGGEPAEVENVKTNPDGLTRKSVTSAKKEDVKKGNQPGGKSGGKTLSTGAPGSLTGIGKGGGGSGLGTIGYGSGKGGGGSGLGTIGYGSGKGSGYGKGAGKINAEKPGKPSLEEKLKEYKVIAGVDSVIPYPKGLSELRVWIGADPASSADAPKFPAGMKKDSTTIPAIGQSAAVQAFAPRFKVTPKVSQCLKIHPTGSEVRFQLEPTETGVFRVGANVYLYDTPDCTGASVPKVARNLRVRVEVDRAAIAKAKTGEMGAVLWDKFIGFWGALAALFFGLLLFLIKGRLKKWFGFQAKD